MIVAGAIKSALVDIDRASEFTGDDVDRFSELVDLGAVFSKVLVWIPTIDSAVISLYIQRDGDKDTIPLPLNIMDADATGSFLHGTTASTGGIAVLFDVGGVQWLRVHSGANQDPDVTFYLRGC